MSERYVFGNLKQEDGESVDAFDTRLREKAATCEYGAIRDELIGDRLVLGITDEGARRRMLREKDLHLGRGGGLLTLAVQWRCWTIS